jgi:acetyl esterase/lipase
MRNLWTILLLCIFCISLTFAAQTPPAKPKLKPSVVTPVPAGVKALKNLEYGKIGERKLLVDLFLPEKAEGKLPVIVWIHGGGWRSGSKEDCFALQTGFVQKGFAVASVGYRLTDEAIFPAQIEDCKSAVRWLRANADKYNLDADHIGAWGSSAGGHLVALLGTTGDIETFDKGDNLQFSSAVQAVCDYYGPVDFQAFVTTPGYERHAGPESAETRLIGGQVLDNPEKAKKVSATTYVSKGDAPFLIIHGDKDPTVPVGQSIMFYDMLKKADVNADYHCIDGAKHGGPEFSNPEIISKVEIFFKKHLTSPTQEKKTN